MHPILSTSLIPDPCVPVSEPLFILFLWPPSLLFPVPPKRSDSARVPVCGVLSMPQATGQLSLFLIPSEFQQISAAVTPTLHGAYLYLCLSSPSTLLPKQI